jgi:hypothetical protein
VGNNDVCVCIHGTIAWELLLYYCTVCTISTGPTDSINGGRPGDLYPCMHVLHLHMFIYVLTALYIFKNCIGMLLQSVIEPFILQM